MITIQIEDRIGHLVIDMPGRSMNVLTPAFADALDQALSEVLTAEDLLGIVISSGKNSFIAGADLAQMRDFAQQDVGEALAMIAHYNRVFRRVETCGKPVVAAASGTALGGGLELMLCCHYRIAADDPQARFGLPEVGLGLLPGTGGTQRLPRLIGIAASLPVLTKDAPMNAGAALKLGILNEVVPRETLRAAAVQALHSGRVRAVAAWDEKGFRLPGGDAYAPANANAMVAANASLNAATKGHLPAPLAILRAVYEGSKLPIEKALKLEQKLFVTLVRGEVAQNLVRTQFFGRQRADKLARRPAGIPKTQVKRLGILGAGFMGAGIAQVSAAAGMEVVLLDRDPSIAQRAREGILAALDAEVQKGRLSETSRDQTLARIEVATDYGDFKHCDLVIEAVLEDFDVKDKVVRAAEAEMRSDAVFASNTSGLPIDDLARSSVRPDRFIGLHFFSPVSRMALVEVIIGKATSDDTLARALDYVQQIRKTPIVVKDGYGFYTSRCVEAYIREGVRLLTDGVNPALVENAGMALGMPVGPLALADEVGIDVLHHVSGFFRSRERGDWADDKHGAGNEVIGRLYNEQRFGRKVSHGFYTYPVKGVKRFDLQTARSDTQPDVAAVKERLLFAQLVEAARCWSDGVIDDALEADLGATLGWAFPAHLGGPLAVIDRLGAAEFVRQSNALTARHGERFSLPEPLRKAALAGLVFHVANA